MSKSTAAHHRRKSKRHAHRGQHALPGDPRLTIDVIDEIASTISLLACLPELKRLDAIAAAHGQDQRMIDPIARHLEDYRPRQSTRDATGVATQDAMCEAIGEVVGCSDSVISAAVWRLQRLESLLSRSLLDKR